ncbi:uncharacterized protein LOC115709130 [Cannabis sativa]|uniref:uncharacterized protein LOC115709130 n=1 Tax=Cannabis sativa TaxID=3483 RepID=UPI0029CA2994|nr:uncharacterized protein LOC115709130 [Cannabis sativa]
MAFSLLVLENSSGMHPSVPPPQMVALVHPNLFCDGLVPQIKFFSSKFSLFPFSQSINSCIYCSECYNEYPSHLKISLQIIKCGNPFYLLLSPYICCFSLSLSSFSPPNFIITHVYHFGFWKMEADQWFNDDLKLRIIIFPIGSRILDKMDRSSRRSQRALWFYLFKGRSRASCEPSGGIQSVQSSVGSASVSAFKAVSGDPNALAGQGDHPAAQPDSSVRGKGLASASGVKRASFQSHQLMVGGSLRETLKRARANDNDDATTLADLSLEQAGVAGHNRPGK